MFHNEWFILNEEQWLACENPVVLLRALPEHRATERKLRLCALAAYLASGDHNSGNGPHHLKSLVAKAVKFAERCAEGESLAEECSSLHHEIVSAGQISSSVIAGTLVSAAHGLLANPCLPPHTARTFHACARLSGWSVSRGFSDPRHEVARVAAVHTQVNLIRDIFGNPFRPVPFSPDWRTTTAVALARQMYESRDFSAAPILADALQDGGCDNDEILVHCRDEKLVHYRGWWLADLVLSHS